MTKWDILKNATQIPNLTYVYMLQIANFQGKAKELPSRKYNAFNRNPTRMSINIEVFLSSYARNFHMLMLGVSYLNCNLLFVYV